MNQTPLQELRETSNSTDLAKMWTVMMDRELVRDNDIVRRLVEDATEFQASLNTRQEIMNEAAIYKNTKMKEKSVAFFREQQDQDLKFIRDISSKISETQLRIFEKIEFVDYMKKLYVVLIINYINDDQTKVTHLYLVI
uniref:Uncharacterized protein n=1 Tax=Tanacetum cinerariifolium TaxID=118510 RepID=A0A699J4W4_TANCI|nr:hypothetical protein [Tanacetum cinerariifolium]